MVTGAAGFLGAAVVDRLLAVPEVERVIGVDIAPMEARDPRHLARERDVADGVADLLASHAVDAIVHHAYLVQPPRRETAARRVNVTATARLLDEAAAAGVGRIVYPSSATVYGPRPGAAAHTEEEPTRPPAGFSYSEHKVAAELLLRAPRDEEGPTVVILRGCVVAGPGATGFILASLSLPVFPVVAGADPEMQFLHVDDYSAAVVAALGASRSGTYNVAGRGTLRVREMVEMVGSRALPLPGVLLRGLIRWTWRLRLQRRSPESGLSFITHPWLVSIAAAEEDLGWAPRYTSREAVAAWTEWRRGSGP